MAVRWLLLAVLLSVVSGCSVLGDTDDEAVTVFAAASLSDVMPQLAATWEASHPNAPVQVSIGGSNALATQIAEGAPADVFLSADLRRPDELVEAGHATGPVLPFAGVRIALAAAPNRADVVAVDDLAGPGVRIVAAGSGVPISTYATEAIAAIAAGTADPQAYTRAVEANTVSREDNVRAALAKVELGEGDAVFVYATDLAGSDAREIPLPTRTATTATYGAVRINGRPASIGFIEWLGSDEAATVLRDAGFEAPPA